jgi:hypothetical protein
MAEPPREEDFSGEPEDTGAGTVPGAGDETERQIDA